LGGGRCWVPSNTKSPGLRPTAIPSDILIHPGIWPQQMWVENWGLCPFIGRLFVKRFALCYQSVVCLSCLSVLSVCNVGVLWPNGWTDQDETWRAGRPRPWPQCVRWGPSSPPLKGHILPNFRPISVAAKWLHGSRCHLVWR